MVKPLIRFNFNYDKTRLQVSFCEFVQPGTSSAESELYLALVCFLHIITVLENGFHLLKTLKSVSAV